MQLRRSPAWSAGPRGPARPGLPSRLRWPLVSPWQLANRWGPEAPVQRTFGPGVPCRAPATVGGGNGACHCTGVKSARL